MSVMRIVKTLSLLIMGPVLGAIVGFVIGGLLLPSDPSGRGSPGDGFLILMCVGWGLIIFAIPSVLIAIRMVRKSS